MDIKYGITHYIKVGEYLSKQLNAAKKEDLHLILIKLFTEESFLYKNLNCYLREENIEEI